MGEERIVPVPELIAPFATRAVDIGKLLPELAWPAQVELRAGKHTVRPRYGRRIPATASPMSM
jgi:hypothetical protein